MEDTPSAPSTVETRNDAQPATWPEVIVEDFADNSWPDLSPSTSDEAVESWVQQNKRVLVRTVTWNLCAEPPPAVGDIQQNLLPKDKFHIYIVGTEECERSIAQSALFPSKKGWEAYLNEAMGPSYIPIRSHTLQAIHLMAFVHKGIAHLCNVVTSAAVPTGMGSTLGNKGGVGLFFKIGSTRFLVVNAHLAAHQTAEKRRNAEFNRINKMIPVMLEKREAHIQAKSVRSGRERSDTVDKKSDRKKDTTGDNQPTGDNTNTTNPTTIPTTNPTTNTTTQDTQPNILNSAINQSGSMYSQSSTVQGSVAPAPGPDSPSSAHLTSAHLTVDTAETAAINTAPHPAHTPPLPTANNTTTTTSHTTTIAHGHNSDHSHPQEHLVPSVETIVDSQGHIMGEVDQCYNIDTGLPLHTPVLQTETPITTAIGADGVNNKRSSAFSAKHELLAEEDENNDTEAAVGSVPGELEYTVNSNINSFTPTATTPTALTPAGSTIATTTNPATNTSNTNTTFDPNAPLADETTANNEGDVNIQNRLDGTAILDVPANTDKTLENSADLVVFMGDLNYRIKGNRKIVSSLVANNMHEVLLHNDQLSWNMSKGLVLQNFTEGPLHFKPTYKYDLGTSDYDTSSKGRIPSWTDRILFVPRPGAVQCLAYNADDSIRTSDHRPVYASFSVAVEVSSEEAQGGATELSPGAPVFTSESQVCTIM